ncbi:MAG: alpha/beta fold hydrolase [Methylobacter sp.]|uniref:alpha/beta fold hydrolase n=1 Tax=Methylobacter sp. TaxID=2051955 RepID=UPI00272F4AC8|nr:alpha/beta fold hydrolase [Methylobacter sp.]MDP1667031.1 alpha/beta fold hydrolase [Methylobacter sp.]MDP1970286.1 alpha/beta fold hydrolase [Methylobacter sp.]
MENLKAKLIPIDKDSEAIILLHGLARTSRSMNKAAKLLAAYGYQIINVDYPSRSAGISFLAQKYIAQALKQCDVKDVKKIHFLTHSMGGILLRDYLANQTIDKLGRVVMLAPPNQGTEIMDKLAGWRLFYTLSGPAVLQLGTDNNSVPNRLGPVNFQLGVIAGDKTVNPLFSWLIPGVNDGIVSISRAQVAGMKDFIVMPYSHPFIMRRKAVIEQALHFIQQGTFAR